MPPVVRRGGLFLPVRLRDPKRADTVAGPDRDRAAEILRRWADMDVKGKLSSATELSLHGEFLVDVFAKALGYALRTDNLPEWHLQQEFSFTGGRSDAAIGRFRDGPSPPPRVLIELKGPKVDLDHDRSNGRTPVQQLWDALNAVPKCPWGILSNYVTIRLYHRERPRHDFEHFTLRELADPPAFAVFYHLFERGGLLPFAEGKESRADQLLRESEEERFEVGDRLYHEYHDMRVTLIEHLRGKPHGMSLTNAIHVAQKLLDRVVFIAFCKERGLLSPLILKRVREADNIFDQVTNPIWRNFRNLFRSIDTGNERLRIPAYNGGLFAPDPLVDDLELEDGWTGFFETINSYDFAETISVDVLGRLFEQSITDLEVLHAPDTEDDRRDTSARPGKRKREGIYYTPPHITRHIIEQTVGATLVERFRALARRHGVNPEADPPSPDRAAFDRDRWNALSSLRVCDPACGSGAFLIQAYDFLEPHYQEVVATLGADGERDANTLRNAIRGTILTENLFGVDLSEEAVEITQLALWIRTAERGKTLTNLSENIRRGNSLVNDPEVDPRAFDWPAAFQRVFDEGGFDCVISNPPYVKLQNFRKREPRVAKFLVERYRAAQTGNFDLYLPFIEKGLALLREGGRMGVIAPNVWLFNEYGQGLRDLVAESRSLDRFIDFKSHQVFRDATTYTALQFFAPGARDAITVADAGDGVLPPTEFHEVPYARLGPAAWALLREEDDSILSTMRERSVTLEEAAEAIIVGIQTSADAVYHLVRLGAGRYYSKALDREVELDDAMMKPLISGEDAIPFATPRTDKFLLFPYLVADDECRLFTEKEMARKFKHCWAYLKKNEKTLRGREDGAFDDDEWWRFGRPQNLDKQELPKIGVPQTVNRLTAFIDPKGERYFNNVRVNGILGSLRGSHSLWFILSVLNCRAADYFFRRIAKPKDREYFEANKQFIAPLPVPTAKDTKAVSDLARKLSDLFARRQIGSWEVERRLVTDLSPKALLDVSPLPPSLPKKLREFESLEARDLLDTMEKFARRDFKPSERAAWDEYLTKERDAMARIDRGIADARGELDERMNRLYGLNAEQVKRIEGESSPE